MSSQRLKVASTSDLPKGNASMKEVEFGEAGKILLSQVDGQYYATGSKCTHYGAPLAKGVITSGGRVVCPWHGACFSVTKCGDIEDAPAPNNLQSFKVEVEGSDIYVTADAEAVKTNMRKTKPPKSTASKDKGVVIVGGGSGALYAVEGLRESGYTGSIKIISKEAYIPVDRTKLSKSLMDDAAKLAMRDQAWYDDNKIELQLSTAVKSVDIEAETVTTDAGQSVGYAHLILASGSEPSTLPLPGKELGNIFTLRYIEDTKAINKAIGDATTDQPEVVQKAEDAVGLGSVYKPNVVVIGSSFIGMEVALAAVKKASVTVIGMDKVPFESILGPEVGSALRANHEKQGIKFYLPAELSHYEASSKDSEKVGAVVLKDGTKIPADLVILGTGVKPITDYAANIPGIQLHEKDKSIFVDEQLRLKGISKKNVYAVGDIARFPDIKTGEIMRIEHWNVAGNHARSVAQTICGGSEPYNKTALFWSAQGAQLRYCGSSKSSQWDQIHIDGEPKELKFAAYYGKGNEVVAVSSMGKDPIVVQCSELFTLKKMPTFDEIKGGKSPLEIPLTA